MGTYGRTGLSHLGYGSVAEEVIRTVPAPVLVLRDGGSYCPADGLACGNGAIRTLHPIELSSDDWLEWSTRNHRVGKGSVVFLNTSGTKSTINPA